MSLAPDRSDHLPPEAYRDGARVLWVGTEPATPGWDVASSVLDARVGFRESPERHRTYDVVALLEADLGLNPGWAFVIDELIRLARPGGLVVVRFTEHQFEMHHLMNLVLSRVVSSELLSYRLGERVIALRTAADTASRSATSLTIGVITDGVRVNRLERLIASVDGLAQGSGHHAPSLLICGPDEIREIVGARRWASFITEETHPTRTGWITRKKNILIDATATDFLVLAHDRYWFPPDFVTRLEEFGADFDVMVPNQLTGLGFEYPVRVATRTPWRASEVVELSVDVYSDSIYVNGGIMVGATDLLRRVRYNELLSWGESEDVEFSRRLRAQGVVPRFAPAVSVFTDITREDQISAFVRPKSGSLGDETMDSSLYPVGAEVRLIDSLTGRRDAQGVTLLGDWEGTSTDSVRPLNKGPARIALRPQVGAPSSSTERWTATFEGDFVREAGNPEILVNGYRAEDVKLGGTTLRFSFTSTVVAGQSLVFQFPAGWPGEGSFHSVRASPERPTLAVPDTIDFIGSEIPDLFFASGWGQPEPWGRWTTAKRAILRLPVSPTHRRRGLVLKVRARAIAAEEHPLQQVAVEVGGVALVIWSFRLRGTSSKRAVIPPRLLVGTTVDVILDVGAPVRLADKTQGDDPRLLGAAISRVRIAPDRRGRAHDSR